MERKCTENSTNRLHTATVQFTLAQECQTVMQYAVTYIDRLSHKHLAQGYHAPAEHIVAEFRFGLYDNLFA